jgi:hypothetical protein
MGLIVMAAGMGLLLARNADDFFARVNTILAAVLCALLWNWADGPLDDFFNRTLPWLIAGLLRWSLFGFFLSLAAIPLHVRLRRDPALSYARAVSRALDHELRGRLDPVMDRYIQHLRTRNDALEDDFDRYFLKKSQLEEELLNTAESCRTLEDQRSYSLP